MLMTPEQLLAHADSGQLWPSNGSEDFSDVTQAYQTALQVRALRMARGERPVGYKVGFTNRSIWPRYQVFAPVWGTVWNTSLLMGGAAEQTTTVSLKNLCQPRIEPEVVMAFKCTPPKPCNAQQLLDSLDWLAPGFEIVQSHLPNWRFCAAQTVADGGLHARLLVGERVSVAALAASADALNTLLAGTRATLLQDGTEVESGLGANVLDSPLLALLHFVNELRSCPGAPDIKPGDVVTTGTWTDAWPVAPRQQWQLRFDAGLPSLTVATV